MARTMGVGPRASRIQLLPSALLEMTRDQTIFLINVSGDTHAASTFASAHRSHGTVVTLSKGSLVDRSPVRQLREFRRLRGDALIFFFDSLQDVSERQLKLASGLFHRCRTTVLADEAGEVEVYGRRDLLLRLPVFVWSALLDAITVFVSAFALRLPLLRARPASTLREGNDSGEGLDIAYLYPFPLYRARPGGRLSFLRGSLVGFRDIGANFEVLSGAALPVASVEVKVIPNRRRFYLFKECQALSYNVRFAFTARRLLLDHRPRVLYQRHGRFVVAGALLARLLGVPLVLEYQTSEYWWAKTWGPARFLSLVRLAEDFSIRSASRLAVVSEVLRDELVDRGIAAEKIVINPAAVDPNHFRPGVGGERTREELGFAAQEVIACFSGSFSYFHGVPVLSEAIKLLLDREAPGGRRPRICFLLVGDGPLRGELEEQLKESAPDGRVVFTGTVSPERVPRILDAADILLAPTVPMPGGKRFFGSPSKLFEYMAMAKAIVASDLEQLADVLAHRETAWLVPPSDPEALANAIELLAGDSELRRRLGANARSTASEDYTWRHNALRLFAAFSEQCDGAQ